MGPSIPPDSRLAALILEGITEKLPWHSLVCALRQHFSCTLVSLVMRHSSEPVWNGCATSDAKWSVAEWTRKFGPRFVAENPFDVERLSPGKVYLGEDIAPRELIARTDWYREVLVPSGIERFVCICLGEPGGYRGWLYLARTEAAGAFTEPAGGVQRPRPADAKRAALFRQPDAANYDPALMQRNFRSTC